MNLFKRIIDWYFSRGALPYWCILAMDSAAVFFSGLFVYYLQHGGQSLLEHFWQVVLGLCVCMVVYIICFFFFHTFRSVMRYSSFVDLHRVAYSTASAGAVVCLLHQIQVHSGLTPYLLIPRFTSTIALFIVATMLLWTIRVVVKSLHDTYTNGSNAERVFIYGCLEGGMALAKSIRTDKNSRYQLVGFISGDHSMSGTWLMGVPVFYDSDLVLAEIKKRKATTLLVSPRQTERFMNRKSFIDSLIDMGVKIMVMSNPEEWDGKSDIAHSQLREIDIEDLLSREKIEVDLDAIGAMLKGRRVLITGAAGSIGSEMARQVALFKPSELILVDQAETPMHDVRLYMARKHSDLKVWTIVGSITNRGHMEEIFKLHKPEYVFHAAAYKHVPMMEDNPAMAVQNNIYGTRVIADLALKYGTTKFVMISTDKAVNPTNVMGCSKRICEIYCQSLNQAITEGKVKGNTQFVTTRFGNVLGSNSSAISIFKEQIRKGGPVTVTHPDIIRFFMLIPEACRLVLEAGTMGKGGEIFVFDMGEPVRIVDLAKKMIALSGAKNIKIEFSGLRDGEKLYEEVLSDKEGTVPTVHPKIMLAKVREYDYAVACANETRLLEASKGFNDMEIVKIMKEIVPEYKSKCSKYEVLDK